MPRRTRSLDAQEPADGGAGSRAATTCPMKTGRKASSAPCLSPRPHSPNPTTSYHSSEHACLTVSLDDPRASPTLLHTNRPPAQPGSTHVSTTEPAKTVQNLPKLSIADRLKRRFPRPQQQILDPPSPEKSSTFHPNNQPPSPNQNLPTRSISFHPKRRFSCPQRQILNLPSARKRVPLSTRTTSAAAKPSRTPPNKTEQAERAERAPEERPESDQPVSTPPPCTPQTNPVTCARYRSRRWRPVGVSGGQHGYRRPT